MVCHVGQYKICFNVDLKRKRVNINTYSLLQHTHHMAALGETAMSEGGKVKATFLINACGTFIDNKTKS